MQDIKKIIENIRDTINSSTIDYIGNCDTTIFRSYVEEIAQFYRELYAELSIDNNVIVRETLNGYDIVVKVPLTTLTICDLV